MEQRTLFDNARIKQDKDICENRHGGAETSVLAHRRGDKAKDKRLVLGFIQSAQAHGMTLDEVSLVLERAPNQLSGRFTELLAEGKISISDRTRPTRTGSPARVYIATGGL